MFLKYENDNFVATLPNCSGNILWNPANILKLCIKVNNLDLIVI